jgi:hypothetical protein
MIDKIAEVSKPNAKEKLLYYTNVLCQHMSHYIYYTKLDEIFELRTLFYLIKLS